MKRKISDIVKRRSKKRAVNLRVDEDLYSKLKEKLYKNETTVSAFFVSLAEEYLRER